MFRKMPVIFLAILLVVGLLYPLLSLPCKSVFYGVSLSLKSVILFLLPFLVFSLLFQAAAQLSKKASKWILGVLVLICLSNFISTMVSYGVGTMAYQFDLSMAIPCEQNALIPWGVLSLPKIIENTHAMFAGLFLGTLCGCIRPFLAERISFYLGQFVQWVLKFFLCMVPLFVVGFFIKMMHDGTMFLILRSYSLVFAIVSVSVFFYIGLLYFFANHGKLQLFMRSLKNMLPAVMTGFGSMSSAAAMPLTILGTDKNTKDPQVARSLIPATVNVHLIGDCFAIPIFALAIMKSFGLEAPSISSYLVFAVYFVFAKFSVAAVPGGGILVMLPLLESYLGFNTEMLSLITALYILFDPVITSANVLGNGGFAMMVSKLMNHKALSKKVENSWNSIDEKKQNS